MRSPSASRIAMKCSRASSAADFTSAQSCSSSVSVFTTVNASGIRRISDSERQSFSEYSSLTERSASTYSFTISLFIVIFSSAASTLFTSTDISTLPRFILPWSRLLSFSSM